MGRCEPGRRRQPRRQLATGSLVQRRLERQPQRLLAGRRNQLDDPADQHGTGRRAGQVQPLHGGTAANGGDFERATDPWVSFSPNGVAHQVALGINDSNVANAVLTSRSSDKGANWEDPVVVKFDDRANFFNDKETLTADPTDSRYVYVTWQRIVAPNERASASGRAGRRLPFDRLVRPLGRQRRVVRAGQADSGPGQQGPDDRQPDRRAAERRPGDAVQPDPQRRREHQRLYRGGDALDDKGDTWSAPIEIDRMITDGVTDPADGHPVRTGDLIRRSRSMTKAARSTSSGRTIASPVRSRSRSRAPRTED